MTVWCQNRSTETLKLTMGLIIVRRL
uniref:Uncharacterized protein n=1 Tax=Anguilla anguilla TaxID=7936 RepID=A0A0E9QUU9_ANGAN